MSYSDEEKSLIDIFLHEKTENTIRTYMKELDNFKAWIRNNDFSTVSIQDAKNYVEWLRYDKKLAERTVRRIVRTLLKFYNTAMKEKSFDINPFYTIELPAEKIDYIDRRHLLNINELQLLLATAKKSGTRDYALVLLLVTSRFTALELDNFCWGDIKYEGPGRWHAEVRTRGRNRTRLIPLRQDVAAVLADYRCELGLGSSINNELESTNHVFLNRYNKPISETGIRKIIYRLCQACNIKRVSPMDLSHLCMGLARVNGATDLALARQAGFSSEAVSRKYKLVLEVLDQPACNLIKLPEHN